MKDTIKKTKPDIRMITRLVPPEGNLVQGQSELQIHPELAKEASRIISASQNHYGASEGDYNLRKAVAEKIKKYNGIEVNPDKTPVELIITNGGTGALVGITISFLQGKSAVVFEPYYPYHCRILEQFGSKAEVFELDEHLRFDKENLFQFCKNLRQRKEFPLRAIIVCTPANPSGKVMTKDELESIAEIANELDLLIISDEVYEHYVYEAGDHISIASLPNMWDRTITVNSFSKSWNISGWRLGYCYGKAEFVAAVNSVANVVYVCPATPLQAALAKVLLLEDDYYEKLRKNFKKKKQFVSEGLKSLGFEIYDSCSSFYLWARIPKEFEDAMIFNQMLIDEGKVAGVPGSAFADSDRWNSFMRFCLAREDEILENSLKRISDTCDKIKARK
jgi:aminotransferase